MATIGRPSFFAQLDGGCSRFGNFVTLPVNRVIFQSIGANRLERPESDVERDSHDFDLSYAKSFKDRVREMQACGWRCHGSGPARKDCLIPLAIR
jgi:hypothetical protein